MPEGDDVTPLDLMRWRLQTQEGRAIYALRKSTIEPTFGIQKEVMGYRQFLVRGFAAVSAEWDLLCIGFNLKKMFAMAMADIKNWLFVVQLLAIYRAILGYVLVFAEKGHCGKSCLSRSSKELSGRRRVSSLKSP